MGAAHVFGDGDCLLRLVDGDNQQLCLVDTGGGEQRRLAGVAEVAFDAEARQAFHGFHVVVDDGGVVAAAEQQVIDQLPDAHWPRMMMGFSSSMVSASRLWVSPLARGASSLS